LGFEAHRKDYRLERMELPVPMMRAEQAGSINAGLRRILMNVKTTFVSALLAALFAGPSAMAADWGFYAGGGVGQATLNDDPATIGEVSEGDSAWKAFGGYRFGGFIPLLDLAAEVTYRDFGNPSGTNFEYEASGFDASALGIVTLGPFDVFARLGVGQYTVESVISGVSAEDDGTAPLYGIGAGLRLGPVNVRAEWERVEPEGVDNIDMYTLNAYFRF
jgi:hypothetical protein